MRNFDENMPESLTPIQRILLRTDGTVTDILHAYLQEVTELVRLHGPAERSDEVNEALEIAAGTPVVHRHSLIRGKDSKQGLILASSTLVPDRLPEVLRGQIARPEMAIGQAIKTVNMETFREILTWSPMPENEVAGFTLHGEDFNAGRFSLQRTYRIFMQGKPCIFIHERFSEVLQTLV